MDHESQIPLDTSILQHPSLLQSKHLLPESVPHAAKKLCDFINTALKAMHTRHTSLINKAATKVAVTSHHEELESLTIHLTSQKATWVVKACADALDGFTHTKRQHRHIDSVSSRINELLFNKTFSATVNNGEPPPLCKQILLLILQLLQSYVIILIKQLTISNLQFPTNLAIDA
jgi:hypothetical protein